MVTCAVLQVALARSLLSFQSYLAGLFIADTQSGNHIRAHLFPVPLCGVRESFLTLCVCVCVWSRYSVPSKHWYQQQSSNMAYSTVLPALGQNRTQSSRVEGRVTLPHNRLKTDEGWSLWA